MISGRIALSVIAVSISVSPFCTDDVDTLAQRRALHPNMPLVAFRPLDADLAKSAYRDMLLARLIDAKAIVLYKQNRCHFQIGCAGHEAIQVATAMHMNPSIDWSYPHYRDMALCAALGMTPREMFLGILNKAEAELSVSLPLPKLQHRQLPEHMMLV